MSGPKTGRYRLTLEQKEIMRALREQQLMLGEEYQRIIDYCEEIAQLMAGLNCLTAAGAEAALVVRSGAGAEDMAAMLSRAERELEKYQKMTIKDFQSSNDGLVMLREKREALAEFHREMSGFYQQAAERQAELNREFTDSVNKAISAGLTMDFSRIGREYHCQIEALLAEIPAAALNNRLAAQLRQITEKLAEHPGEEFLKTYHAVTVVPFVKECYRWQQQDPGLRQEWEALCRRHAALLRENDMLPASGIPRMELSKEAIVWLTQENARLEQKLEQAQAQSYISRAVDEVVAEMDYQLLGQRDVVKKSGKRFRNELYNFDDDTVVSVTTDDSGQITMELGQPDTVDRAPSVAESRLLCQKMALFCDDFSEMGERLAARGIIADELVMLPAKDEYAQIINVSEYEMAETGTLNESNGLGQGQNERNRIGQEQNERNRNGQEQNERNGSGQGQNERNRIGQEQNKRSGIGQEQNERNGNGQEQSVRDGIGREQSEPNIKESDRRKIKRGKMREMSDGE